LPSFSPSRKTNYNDEIEAQAPKRKRTVQPPTPIGVSDKRRQDHGSALSNLTRAELCDMVRYSAKEMRLFICHVSEDKSDFVAPLARKLREHFDVWYDDFQLTLGDNLLQKITEGLTTSDFGVVVLSKLSFERKSGPRTS
jgi:hypothetical protein